MPGPEPGVPDTQVCCKSKDNATQPDCVDNADMGEESGMIYIVIVVQQKIQDIILLHSYMLTKLLYTDCLLG